MYNTLLRRIAVAHMADVADVNRGAIHRLDRQIVEILDRLRRVVQLDRVLLCAEFHRSGGNDLVLRSDGVADILRGKPACLQRL
jgi:hypothetical protein